MHSLWLDWGQEEGEEAAILHGGGSLGMFGDLQSHCLISDSQFPASGSRSAPWFPQDGRHSINP